MNIDMYWSESMYTYAKFYEGEILL
jgi:hypothetical protein